MDSTQRSAGLTSPSLRSIELAPLAREDVEELLAAVSGRVVELGDVAAEFHQQTQGNPLQVRQLLYRAQREAHSSRADRVTAQVGTCASSRRSKSLRRRLSSSAATSTSSQPDDRAVLTFAVVHRAASSTWPTPPQRPRSRRTW